MSRLRTLRLAVFLVGAARAADPKEHGWHPLFDGTDLAGWISAAGLQPGPRRRALAGLVASCRSVVIFGHPRDDPASFMI